MNQDKMHLINKIFNNETIRKYWSDLKSKLKQEGNEVYEKIGQLKLKSQDGKFCLTDVFDIEEILM